MASQSSPPCARMSHTPETGTARAKTVGGPRAFVHASGQRYPKLCAANESLRHLLLEVLRRKGTAQAELAEDLQVPATLVAAWCAGKRTIPASVFLALQNGRFAEALLYATLEKRRANDNAEHR